MTTHIFTEAIDLSEAQIDTDNRVLRGAVLIRAGESANGNVYRDEVLQRDAHVFNETIAYLNHPSQDQIKKRQARGLQEFTGVYKNVRYVAGALKGDRVFANNQAGRDAMQLAEQVINGEIPSAIVGLSINATGTGKREDGKLIVESFTKAESVDDVLLPAAGGSYIESASGDALLDAILQAMTFEEWYQSRPEYTERVKKEMKTVRQDTALTEAQALAERVQAELDTAQETLRQLEAQRVADATTMDALRREVAFEKMARKISFPKEWEASLRAQLLAIPMAEWSAIVETEKQKARAAGHRANVNGAGQQVNTPLPMQPRPRDPVAELRERLANAKDLDEFNQIMAALQEIQT